MSALIVSAVGAYTAWAVQPRFSLVNAGTGLTVRLDRSSGDMIACRQTACATIVEDNLPVKQVDEFAAFRDAP
ncbi:MAG TPA: hypothetical protein VF637_04310 [Sphingomicrobium sp.]